MTQGKALLLIVICLGFLGTTYVIKEGGKEVGRYDENDGKKEIVELNNAAPKPVVKPAKVAVSPPPVAQSNNANFDALRALAEQMAGDAKQKNTARREEVQQALKEMEQGY